MQLAQGDVDGGPGGDKAAADGLMHDAVVVDGRIERVDELQIPRRQQPVVEHGHDERACADHGVADVVGAHAVTEVPAEMATKGKPSCESRAEGDVDLTIAECRHRSGGPRAVERLPAPHRRLAAIQRKLDVASCRQGDNAVVKKPDLQAKDAVAEASDARDVVAARHRRDHQRHLHEPHHLVAQTDADGP